MQIITVDFDGTLYQQDSIAATLKAGGATFSLRQWAHIIKDIAMGIVNRKGGGKTGIPILFLESFFQQMRGRSGDEIDEFFISLIEKGQGGINWDLVSAITGHLNDGSKVIILSGALQPFLEVFIEYLGMEADVIGTQLFFDEKGICAGRIGKINNGIEKVNRLKAWIDENNVGDRKIWAYADSESDIPLLEFADKAIVVQPSDALKRIAESKGWETFTPTQG